MLITQVRKRKWYNTGSHRSESYSEQILTLAKQDKLNSIEILPVRFDRLINHDLLPTWAQSALAENRLYLVAYPVIRKSGNGLNSGSAMLFKANRYSQKISVNNLLLNECKEMGFYTTVGCMSGLLNKERVDERFTAIKPARYLLTDVPLI